jgi:hypothetical protein
MTAQQHTGLWLETFEGTKQRLIKNDGGMRIEHTNIAVNAANVAQVKAVLAEAGLKVRAAPRPDDSACGSVVVTFLT